MSHPRQAFRPPKEFSEIIKLAGGLGALSDGHVLPYWQIFLGHSFRSCACKFFQIGFFVISSAPVYIKGWSNCGLGGIFSLEKGLLGLNKL